MAGDWLKVEKDTPEKPEIFAIAAKLNLDPEIVFAKCFKVWRWADSNTVDGVVENATSLFLDALCHCPGFTDALIAAGWLISRQGRIQFPNFNRHLGQTAKKRSQTARRVSKHRECNASRNANVNASGVSASSLLSSDSSRFPSEGNGGAGERGPPQETEVTEVLLAEQWCFLLARKKLGTPRDFPPDMVAEFRELIRLGQNPRTLLQEVLRPQRDRGEFFWQFKKRITGEATNADGASGLAQVHRVRADEAKLRQYDARTKRAPPSEQ